MERVMKTILLLVFFYFAAGVKADAWIYEKTGPLTLNRVSKHNIAHFDGEIWVAGTVVASWVRGIDEIERNTFRVQLLPDAQSISKLPHMPNYPIRRITFIDDDDALKVVFSKAELAQLRAKKTMTGRRSGKFLLTDYQTSVECDSPWVHVRVIRFVAPPRSVNRELKYAAGCGQ